MMYFILHFIIIAIISKCKSNFTVLSKSSVHIHIRGIGEEFLYPLRKNWFNDYKYSRSMFMDVREHFYIAGSRQALQTAVFPKLYNKSRIEYAFTGKANISNIIKTYNLHVNENNTSEPIEKNFLSFPFMAGAIVISYNLPSVPENVTLFLNMKIIVGIYNGTYKYWDDQIIQKLNVNVNLPHMRIIVVADDSKDSTLTNAFTSALSFEDENWKKVYGIFNGPFQMMEKNYNATSSLINFDIYPLCRRNIIGWVSTNDTQSTILPKGCILNWKRDVIGIYSKKSFGTIGVLLSVDYSIGYLPLVEANSRNIRYALLYSKYNITMKPNRHSLEAAMINAYKMDSDNSLKSLDEILRNMYPIYFIVYIIMRKNYTHNHMPNELDNMNISHYDIIHRVVSNYRDLYCLPIVEFLGYLDWIFDNVNRTKTWNENSIILLNNTYYEKIKKNYLGSITCNNKTMSLLAYERSIFEIENLKNSKYTNSILWAIPLSIIVPLLLLILFILLCMFIYKYYKINIKINKELFFVPMQNIELYVETINELKSGRNRERASLSSIDNIQEVRNIEKCINCYTFLNNHKKDIDEINSYMEIIQWPVKFNFDILGFKKMKYFNYINFKMKKKFKIKMVEMKRLRHNNVTSFFGYTTTFSYIYYLEDYCSRGYLEAFLNDCQTKKVRNVSFPLAIELTKGLNYLLSKKIVLSNFEITNCLLDYKWNLKISSWQENSFYHTNKNYYLKDKTIFDNVPYGTIIMKSKHFKHNHLYYSPKSLRGLKESKQSNIYTLSMIIWQIFSYSMPYFNYLQSETIQNVLYSIFHRSLRPMDNQNIPYNVQNCLEKMWDKDESIRPHTDVILKILMNEDSLKISVLDIMIAMLERQCKIKEKIKNRKDAKNFSKSVKF